MRFYPLTFLLGLWLCAVAAADFTPDPRYVEADRLMGSHKFVKAREIAEEMLRQSPDSFEAQILLGRVQLEGEGNPGKADYYLRKGLKNLKSQYSAPNYQGAPWKCYADALWALYRTSMSLERYEEAMDWVDEYDGAYPPARPHLKGWPLMKLGRLKEARQKMEAALAMVDDNEDAVNTVLNTQGAIEYESGEVASSLATQEKILQRIERGKGQTDAVFYTNAAESARDLLDFAKAEKYLLEGTRCLSSETYSAPWSALAEHYLLQGRQPEATQALKRHAKHLASLSADIQVEQKADAQRILGMTLLACGYDSEAVKLLRQTALHGDRNSATSTERSLVRSRNFFFYREALKQQRERIREEQTFGPVSQWFKLWLEEMSLNHEMEAARRECAALALSNGGPASMIAPFGPRGFNCPWLTPAISEVFGEGVVSVAAAREIESLPEQARPFAQAILAEAKSDEEAMAACLESLPPSAVLLRARLHALLAKESGAAEDFQKALETDPPVVRRLGLAVPVKLNCSDSTLKHMIADSPRFRAKGGLVLSVEGNTGNGFQGQLLGLDGSVLSQFRSPGGADPEQARLAFCRELHQKVFAPRVNLTQMEINGLDGSNLAGGQLRVKLEDIVGKKSGLESEKNSN